MFCVCGGGVVTCCCNTSWACCSTINVAATPPDHAIPLWLSAPWQRLGACMRVHTQWLVQFWRNGWCSTGIMKWCWRRWNRMVGEWRRRRRMMMRRRRIQHIECACSCSDGGMAELGEMEQQKLWKGIWMHRRLRKQKAAHMLRAIAISRQMGKWLRWGKLQRRTKQKLCDKPDRILAFVSFTFASLSFVCCSLASLFLNCWEQNE